MPRILAPVLVLALCAGQPAFAHDAQSGWGYPLDCCSGIDCFPIRNTDIEAIDEGYRIKATSEVIPYASRKIKSSGDGGYHRRSFGGAEAASTICLFVPAGS